jgi:hypothetical protein
MLVGADIVAAAVVALAAIEIGRTGIGFQAHAIVGELPARCKSRLPLWA